MNNFFRGLIATYGAAKLGGGCLGFVVVFILIWTVLGECSFTYPPAQHNPRGIHAEWHSDTSGVQPH